MIGKTWLICTLLLKICYCENNTTVEEKESHEGNEDSNEIIGATVTQIVRHPYAASLQKNDMYICSAVILNNYWLLTATKCFDPNIILSYTTYTHLKNFTVRVGSSYNNKGGSVYKLRMMMHNFDIRVTALKVHGPIGYNSRVQNIQLPNPEDEITLGFLVSIVAWTPTGHMRAVNAPAMDTQICESYTKLKAGQFICVGGVQDPDRHFCRKDNGGAIIQNNTLVGLTTFIMDCANYAKAHAFPKIASFANWIDSTIWDEDNRPTTLTPRINVTTAKSITTEAPDNSTDLDFDNSAYPDPRKFMLTLPFDPVNVPLEPSEDNSVIPRMSLYESYIQNVNRAKTSTTENPREKLYKMKQAWLKKMNNAMIMMPKYPKKYDQFDFN